MRKSGCFEFSFIMEYTIEDISAKRTERTSIACPKRKLFRFIAKFIFLSLNETVPLQDEPINMFLVEKLNILANVSLFSSCIKIRFFKRFLLHSSLISRFFISSCN